MIRNRFIKGLGYIGIGIITLITSYIIALVGMCFPFSLVCAVWSFITPLPAYIAENYGIILLQCSIPVCMIVFSYTLKHALKK